MAENKKESSFNRLNGLIVVMVILFIIILIRLFNLQVMQVDNYKQAANTSQLRQIPIAAPRGQILDSKNKLMATSIQGYNLTFTKPDDSNKEFFNTFKRVFQILDKSKKKNKDGLVVSEIIDDSFELKIKENNNKVEYYFDFAKDIKDIKILQFQKDRGTYQDYIEGLVKSKVLKENENYSDYTDAQWKSIEEKLKTQTPEQIFAYLAVKYKLYQLVMTDDEANKMLLDSDGNSLKEDNLILAEQKITNEIFKKYSPEDVRRYMVILDKLYLQSFQAFKPVVVSSNISSETSITFQQLKSELPGIDVATSPIRYYPMGETGSAFLGYISKISGAAKKYEERGYDVNKDMIGMDGLESSFESTLRGTKGNNTINVNSQGQQVSELFKQEANPGNNLVLSIDSDLQKVTEQALKDNMKDIQTGKIGGTPYPSATMGAAAVIEVNTGRILSLVSEPGYDPNMFSIPGYSTDQDIEKLLVPDYIKYAEEYIGKTKISKTVNDLFPIDRTVKSGIARYDKYGMYPSPMYNYATMGLIPPGSVFKIATATAGLEENVINENTLINDNGKFKKYEESYEGACWTYNGGHPTHGNINILEAITVSCNYFFFQVGENLYSKYAGSDNFPIPNKKAQDEGLNSLANWAWKFGLGADPQNGKAGVQYSTGIEIYENFGQTYNTYSRKNLAKSQVDINEADMLSKGYYENSVKRFTFTPIVYSILDTDSEEEKAAKQALSNKLKEVVTSTGNTGYNDLKIALPTLFENLIKSLPPDKQSKYTQDDIDNMVESTAQIMAYDLKTQVDTRGNLYDSSIGQGMNNFTPLQIAHMVSTIMNGGTRYKLHLVDKITDSNNKVIQKFDPVVLEKTDISESTLNIIKQGMQNVEETGGTGAQPSIINFNKIIPSIGKTGSASFNSEDIQKSLGRTEYSTFIGAVPKDDPQIAVCAVIYNGHSGGYLANTVTAIYEEYFKDEIKKQFPNYIPSCSYSLNPSSLDAQVNVNP